MADRGILDIEADRLLAKVQDGVICLHRHDKDHVMCFLDVHLINAFKVYW